MTPPITATRGAFPTPETAPDAGAVVNPVAALYADVIRREARDLRVALIGWVIALGLLIVGAVAAWEYLTTPWWRV